MVRKLLSDPRVDPRDVNHYAIKAALIGGHSDVVQLLLMDKRLESYIIEVRDSFSVPIVTLRNSHTDVKDPSNFPGKLLAVCSLLIILTGLGILSVLVSK